MSSTDKIKTSLSVLTQEFKVYEEYKENYDFLLNLPVVQKLLIQNMNLELELRELKNKNKVLNNDYNDIYEKYINLIKQTNIINSSIEKPVLKKQHIQIKTEKGMDLSPLTPIPSYKSIPQLLEKTFYSSLDEVIVVDSLNTKNLSISIPEPISSREEVVESSPPSIPEPISSREEVVESSSPSIPEPISSREEVVESSPPLIPETISSREEVVESSSPSIPETISSREDVVEDDEDNEVFELEIDGKVYYATDEDNGIIYNIDENGDIGIEIGKLINGEPIFY